MAFTVNRVMENREIEERCLIIPDRGDIYWIENGKYRVPIGSEQKASRPGIIVSNDENNRHSNTVEVVYLTTAPKKELPTHCQIDSSTKPSIALCEQIVTISKERLGDFIGECTDEEMENVNRCLAVSLGLPYTETGESLGMPYIEDDPELAPQPCHNEELREAQQKAEMYERMYNDLLSRILERKR